jgi:hypothetical protein
MGSAEVYTPGMDRMEQIKANMAASRRNLRPPYIGDDDADWLVSEVERLRALIERAAAALEACRDPWYSAEDHGDPACPEPSCSACWRQEEEAREKARASLNELGRLHG